MKTMGFRIGLAVAVLLAGNVGWAQPEPNDCCRSLTLNGHLLNTNTFVMNSRGALAMVEGDPRSARRRPLSFRVLLRRAGAVVRQWPADTTENVYLLRLDELWPVARPGDEVVIEPDVTPIGNSSEPVFRRVIRLTPINWLALGGC